MITYPPELLPIADEDDKTEVIVIDPASGWITVDSAPMGVPVLAYFPDALDPVMKVERLEFEGDPDGPQWWICDVDGQLPLDVEPVLWMPLPQPPESI